MALRVWVQKALLPVHVKKSELILFNPFKFKIITNDTTWHCYFRS